MDTDSRDRPSYFSDAMYTSVGLPFLPLGDIGVAFQTSAPFFLNS